MSRIWREPGMTVRSRSTGSERPRRTAATIARSSYDELTELPTQTCASAFRRPRQQGRHDRARRAGRSAAPAPPGRSSPPRRRRHPGRPRARPSDAHGAAPRATAVSARRSGRCPRSRRSPSPCCRSSRGRSRSARSHRRRGTRRCSRGRHGRRGVAAARAQRPSTAPRGQPTEQLDADDTWALDEVRATRHRDRDLGRAGADREHPERPAMVVWLSAPTSTGRAAAKRSRWR